MCTLLLCDRSDGVSHPFDVLSDAIQMVVRLMQILGGPGIIGPYQFTEVLYMTSSELDEV